MDDAFNNNSRIVILGIYIARSLSGDMEIKMTEAEYQSRIINKVREMMPTCVVLKNDSSYMPGIPDLLILYRDRWAMLEVKLHPISRRQANQEYYVDYFDAMSFAAFICPEHEEAVLYDLQCTFGLNGKTRVSEPQ